MRLTIKKYQIIVRNQSAEEPRLNFAVKSYMNKSSSEDLKLIFAQDIAGKGFMTIWKSKDNS